MALVHASQEATRLIITVVKKSEMKGVRKPSRKKRPFHVTS